MARPQSSQSKTARLSIDAITDEDREIIRKYKEICAEKGVAGIYLMRDWLREYTKDHWPPNPQLQIGQFTGHLPLSPETRQTLNRKQRKVTCACAGRLNCAQCGGNGFYYEEST